MTTERDDKTETDGYRFVWWREWRQLDGTGHLREYTTPMHVDGAEQLGIARADHATDCRGGWVRHGMIDPHVSGLRVQEKGRLLLEELAPKRDLDEVALQPSMV